MWSRLIGQETAVRILRDAVASGAPGHAYLFVGPQGVGRELAAMALAASLKVLEEPPGDVVFVLVTESPEDLLPTVVSRCRRVDFFPLAPAEIERVLVTQHDAEPSLASWAARTGGDLSTALRFVKDPGAPERRRAHLDIPGRLVRSGPSESVRIAAELAEEAAAAVSALPGLLG